MTEERRNALERVVETLHMTGALPPEMDFESAEMKAMLDTLPEARRVAFQTMAKDPYIRKMSNVFNVNMGDYWSDVLEARSQGKKMVFIPFNCSPEIFYALDIVPIGVEILNTMAMTLEEGIHEYLDLSVERGLPDTMCSSQRGVVGLLEAGLLDRPDFLVNGALGGCDPNSKAFEYISEKFDVPAMYLDVPYYHDDRSMAYYTKGFKQVVEALEELSGNKLDEDRLREVCELSNQSTELAMEINELKRNVPNPVPNYYNTIHLATKLTMTGTKRAVDVFQTALDVSQELLAKGAHVLPEEKIRMMMMYTSLYFDGGLHLWLQEEMGVSYLNDLLVFYDFNPIIDTTNMETMLYGLSKTMLNLPMTRQLKGSWDMPANWLHDLLYYVETYKADCLVFTGHTACKQVWGVYRLVADEIKKQLGVPSVRLEGDGWDSRITPLSVFKEHLSEFFETLA
ncbi:MAG: 2-hydroxyacyl-CoA dehydratase [Proteobacteria bacterium]|nr:2-hydroxyacyl-CoA dehydratase [Pseudomonadota bacterium]